MSETRTQRVADQIQREIASLLTNGQLKDPRLGFVTITGVEVTADFMEAKVYFVAHGSDAEVEGTREALVDNAGKMRSHLGRAMRIHHAPELRFVQDPSIDEGEKIDRLLKEVRDKEGW